MLPKARLVLFMLLAVGSTLIRPSESKKMTACQQAYFLLRQCSSELSGAKTAGNQCCELLSAFDIRECVATDDRVKAFDNKLGKLLQPLRVACDVLVPSQADKTAVDGNDDALEQAAKSLSQARDSSMHDNIISVARAVMASETDSAKMVTVELAVEGGVEEINAAVKTAVNTATALLAKNASKKGGIMLQEISLEMDRDAEEGVFCACENAELPELKPDTGNLVALRYAYLAARLSICKYTCAHKGLVLGGLIVQMAVLGAWIVCLLARPLWARSRRREERKRSASQSSCTSGRSSSPQFIADAGEAQWTEPLLSEGDEEQGVASSR